MPLQTRRLIGSGAVGLLLAACTPAPPPVVPTLVPVAPVSTSGPTSAPTVNVVQAPTAAPAPSPPPTSTPAAGAGLVEAALGNLSKTLHPYPDSASYTQPWIYASALIWGGADGGGGLLAFDWDALDYRPALASALPKVSADGKTFTFTLRADLKWSDGTPITVEDFQFAYDQASREDNRYVQLDLIQDIATFRTPDARTIEIALKDAKPRDVALGIVNIVGPVPKNRWNGKSWTDAATNPEILNPSVVLGPFKVQEFRLAEHGLFTPVDTYFVGKPKVPSVEILANQQPTVAYESLKSGRANWVHSLPPAQYQDAKANPGLNVVEWTAANAAYRTIEFNLARPILSDKRVRQALAYAISRADLLDVAEQGLALSQFSFVPPTNTRWVNASVEHYAFDLAHAQSLLAEAGYVLRNGQLVGKDGVA